MAPARTLLVSGANGAAVVCFVIAGAVRWPEMLAMLTSAIVGGYGAARVAKRLPPGLIRVLVLVLSATVTAWFFLRRG